MGKQNHLNVFHWGCGPSWETEAPSGRDYGFENSLDFVFNNLTCQFTNEEARTQACE